MVSLCSQWWHPHTLRGYVWPGALGQGVRGIVGEWLAWRGNALISSVFISWRSVAHGGLREQGYREWDNGQPSFLLWHYCHIREAVKPIRRSNILYPEVLSCWFILGKTILSECICGVVRLETSSETSMHIRHLLGHTHREKYVPESQMWTGSGAESKQSPWMPGSSSIIAVWVGPRQGLLMGLRLTETWDSRKQDLVNRICLVKRFWGVFSLAPDSSPLVNLGAFKRAESGVPRQTYRIRMCVTSVRPPSS